MTDSRDEAGSFDGIFDPAGDCLIRGGESIIFYAPRDLPFWRHWIALAAERWLGRPYPTEVIFSGTVADATTALTPDGGSATFSVKADGTYQIDMEKP